METIVKLYSTHKNEINRFLNSFFANNNYDHSVLEWQKKYQNPVEVVDIIGTFIENNDKFKINMWISLDKDIFIKISEFNANDIIKYLFERYPY